VICRRRCSPRSTRISGRTCRPEGLPPRANGDDGQLDAERGAAAAVDHRRHRRSRRPRQRARSGVWAAARKTRNPLRRVDSGQRGAAPGPQPATQRPTRHAGRRPRASSSIARSAAATRRKPTPKRKPVASVQRRTGRAATQPTTSH
jgi:hypothetical protein